MAQALVLASVGILAAVLNRLSGGALRTWIPWFTQRLLDLAIKRLPEDQRERFAEEWASHINDMPGDVGKIAFASGCVSAAHEMASLLNNSAFTRFLDQCRDFLNRAMRPFNFAGSTMALFLEDIVLRERGVMRTIAMLTLVGGVLGFLTYLPMKKFFARYTSQSVVLIESQKVPENMVQPVVSDDLNARVGMLRALATSDSEMQPVLTNLFPGKSTDEIARVLEDMRSQPQLLGAPLSDLSQITTDGSVRKQPAQTASPGFMVSYVASDPRDAQRVCEAVTSKIVQKNLEFIQASAKGTVDVLTQGIDRARRQLGDQESKLASQKRHGIADPQQQANIQIMQIELEVAQKNYQDLLAKKYTADLTADMTNQAQGERMSEIQPASLPDTPDFPNIFSFVGGGLGGGLVLGVGLSLWIKIRRRFVKAQQVREAKESAIYHGSVKHGTGEPVP
jgi:hypothetical protein